ncbi:MAG: Pyruvate kinase [Microgenomates bacterium OLB23]|nr:MAG: Pyruvate kinase [Microgenomates bacterium OLB23]
MQLTKIIATVGPDILSPQAITDLIAKGVSVFRFNFKHNTVEWHSEGIQMVNRVSEEIGKPVATLIDLQGPSIRIHMPTDSLALKKNEKIYFGEVVFEKNVKGLSITYPNIITSLNDGQLIVADDGNFRFTVHKEGSQTYLVSHTAGVLLNKKSLNIPGGDFPFPALVARDFEGIQLAAREEVDYIALSFVRSKADIDDLRAEMKKYKITADVISKIETMKALDNIDEIIAASDGIMVARGDLGVELPFEEVPYYQKLLIAKCLDASKPVITATQMLNSMIEHPIPTRAEVSDVANAVYDFTDAVMLSGETAFGNYPFKSVEAMQRITTFNEKKLTFDLRKRYKFVTADNEARVCEMAYNLFLSLAKDSPEELGGFLVFTRSGRTARLLSRYRPRPAMPIFAFTDNETVRDKLALSFAVQPILFKEGEARSDVKKDQILSAIAHLTGAKLVKKGKLIIVLHGDKWAVTGGTSTVKLLKAQ